MNHINKTQAQILSTLRGGQLLLIMPPFTTNTPVIAPHILRGIAQEKGIETEILYLNMLLSSIIGVEFAEKLVNSQILRYWSMITERLFARSAYGLPPLGIAPEACLDEALSISGGEHGHRRTDAESQTFDLDTFRQLEETCVMFVEDAVRAIASLPYAIIGCTARIGQTNCSVALLNGLKRLRPELITLMGGANCQGEMAEGVLSLTPSLDYVFSGESEIAFGQFLDEYTTRSLPKERVLRGAPLPELDSQPLLDYAPYFEQVRQFLGADAPPQPFVWYETSRGCWWGERQKCAFCGRNNESIAFRQKSPEKVFDDLRELKLRYPDVSVAMTDNIMPFAYARDLLPRLAATQETPPIAMYYAKPNLSLRDMIAAQQAKIGRFIPGIETLSNRLLKLLNKGATVKNNLQFLRHGRAVEIDVHWFLLWGIPGDRAADYEEMFALLPLIRHFQPPIALFCVHLERNSAYLNAPERHSITRLRPWNVYRMIYPAEADIEKLASFFVGDYPGESLEQPEIIARLSDEVTRWRQSWTTAKLALIPFGEDYLIYDSRWPGAPKSHFVQQAHLREIMTPARYAPSEWQQWAVAEKVGVVVDSWYIPLATASPKMLLQFEP